MKSNYPLCPYRPSSQNDFLKGWGGVSEQNQGGEGSRVALMLTLDSQKLETPTFPHLPHEGHV